MNLSVAFSSFRGLVLCFFGSKKLLGLSHSLIGHFLPRICQWLYVDYLGVAFYLNVNVEALCSVKYSAVIPNILSMCTTLM